MAENSSRRTFLKFVLSVAALKGRSFAYGKVRKPFRIGVNLAGAEFKAIGGKWNWPSLRNLEYYLDNGFNVFRVPFNWSRLQPTAGGHLDDAALLGLDNLIKLASSSGAVIVLDCHDYGRRNGTIIGASAASSTAENFAKFWGLLAHRYSHNNLVWYGLMNEPHDLPPNLNLAVQNGAARAIRASGATSKILFSGVAWTGAHSWVKSGNAVTMLAVEDPRNNYAFDMHQYLDPGYGGSGRAAVPNSGAVILSDAYKWAVAHGKEVFLGEFGTGVDQGSLRELDDMLDFIARRRNVFIGATYFAGGGVWGRSLTSSDPVDGIDKPQTLLMKRYLKRKP